MTPDLQKLKAEREADQERHCDSLSLKVYQHLLMQQGHQCQMPTREMIRRALLAATAPHPDSVPVKVFARVYGDLEFIASTYEGTFDPYDTHQAVAWIDCQPVVKVQTTEAMPCD